MSETTSIRPPRNTIAALQRLAKPRAVEERCDLCSTALAPLHSHLLELASRQLQCACEPCAVLFSNTEHGKYRRVPNRIEFWPEFVISDVQWESLGVPIALAFFYYSSTQEQFVGVYPSPGGATEAPLAGEVWQLLCDDNPRLARLEPDVEALLVYRIRGAREYYRVPIDECFKLVGIVRTNWQGLSGGVNLWKEIAQFLEQLKARSAGRRTHA